jgi:hypothetical protein
MATGSSVNSNGKRSRTAMLGIGEEEEDSGPEQVMDDTSSEHSIDGVNREGGEFSYIDPEGGELSCVVPEGGEFSYSITSRWGLRKAMWERWQDKNLTNEKLEAQNLDGLALPTSEDLLVDIDDKSSQLATYIKQFYDDTEQSSVCIAEWNKEIELLKNEMGVLALQRDGLRRENELLTVERDYWDVQLTRINQLPVDDRNDDIARVTAELNAEKAGRIAEKLESKTELIMSKTELIAEKAGRIASNSQLIKSKMEAFKNRSNLVYAFISDIHIKHDNVRNMFSNIHRFGNESMLTQPVTQQTLDSTRVDKTAVPSPSQFAMIEPQESDELKTELINLARENKRKAEILLDFQKFVADLLKKAEESDDTKLVKATTNAVLSWKGENKFVKKRRVRYARPPTSRDRETKVDHPILHAVICRIIRILADSPSTVPDRPLLHQHEHGVTNEQSVAGSVEANMRARRVDCNAQHRTEYMAVVLPLMIDKPIEIKTAPVGEADFMRATEKGRSQVFGHLGKRVNCAFDFGGAGQDACAVGISLTCVSIEVLKMTLTNVGTPDVEIASSTTGRLPLLERDMMSEGQKKAANGDANIGFLVLAGALMYKTSSQQEELPDITGPDGSSIVVQSYLGSGAFSNVYKLKQDGHFLKMPRAASLARNLEREAGILQKLQMGVPCCSIPQRDSGVSTFKSKIRGEISFITGLKLRGVVGLPLHRLLRCDWDTHSKSIVETIVSALNFAHGKNILHLDVRPGNIIVNIASGGQCSAMLSDWGCAFEKIGKVRKLGTFHGCTPYAHDRLLGKSPPYMIGEKGELDFASLTYTLVHVCIGELQWIAAFARPSQVSMDDKNLRRKFVNQWLDSNVLGLPKATIHTLRAACHRSG